MNRRINIIVSVTLATILAFSATGCGQTKNQTSNQGQSKVDSQEQSEEESKEFSPKYPVDTEYKLSVVGTYSNFE